MASVSSESPSPDHRATRRRWILAGAAVLICVIVVLLVVADRNGSKDGRNSSDPRPGLPAADSCGAPVVRPDGRPWRCSFADDFDGSALDADRWRVLTTAATGGRKHECRVDSPQNVAVRDGVLLLTARREAGSVVCESSVGDYRTPLTAGAVTTGRRFAQAYGRVEIRAAMPVHRGPGFHSALWMYPQEPTYGPWPASGEIDIMEYRTVLFGRAVPSLHRLTLGEHETITDWHCSVSRPADFHSYVLEWSRAGIRFVYDGRVCLVVRFDPSQPDSDRPFDRPFVLILNQSHGGGRNLADPLTPSSATMRVDYVRVWR